MLLIMDMLFGHGGMVEEEDFAERLHYWIYHGFPELGDLSGLGIGSTVHVRNTMHLIRKEIVKITLYLCILDRNLSSFIQNLNLTSEIRNDIPHIFDFRRK